DAPGTTTISAAQMKDYLTFVASDEMEGRSTPSRGLDTAAKFIATLLARWEVKPGGDEGTYFQNISMSSKRAVSEKCSAMLNGRALVYGTDYVALLSGEAGSASGSLVYAGDGWMIKSAGVDAYRGLDVKGKIVIVNMASGRGRANPEGKEGVDW